MYNINCTSNVVSFMQLLRQEYRFRVFENKVLREKESKSKLEKIALCIISSMMIQAGHVAHVKEEK